MDSSEFDQFYLSNVRSVIAQIYLTCGNLTEAQDCAQEAFTRAWEHRKKLAVHPNPEAWVRTTAHRLSISRWRKARRSLLLGDRTPDTPVDGPDVTSNVALREALAQLPEPTRHVVVLHYLHDLSIAQISEEISAPEGTIKARLHRGRAALAQLLGTPEPTADHEDATSTAASGHQRKRGAA